MALSHKQKNTVATPGVYLPAMHICQKSSVSSSLAWWKQVRIFLDNGRSDASASRGFIQKEQMFSSRRVLWKLAHFRRSTHTFQCPPTACTPWSAAYAPTSRHAAIVGVATLRRLTFFDAASGYARHYLRLWTLHWFTSVSIFFVSWSFVSTLIALFEFARKMQAVLATQTYTRSI